MNNTNLAMKYAAVATVGLMATGCASLDDGLSGLPRQQVTVNDAVLNTKAVLDPCSREGIKARPARMVTAQEMSQRTRAGEVNYFYNGYYLFSKKSLVEEWAPLAGALALGALGNGIGSGAIRAATTVGGAAAGGYGGGLLADQAKLKRMAQEAGCEGYLADKIAPQPNVIDIHRPATAPVDTGRQGRFPILNGDRFIK